MEYTLINKKGGLYVDCFGKLKKVIRAWESWNGMYWFALEESERIPAADSITGKEEIIYMGLVQALDEELGDFSLSELESLKPKVWELKGNGLLCSGRRH
jgi:hypothetical protein